MALGSVCMRWVVSRMPLHLIKLCVGCDSVADLEDWIKLKLKEKKRRGQKPEHIHTTRMLPKRADELTDGGSLYWVIQGQITCREKILDIRTDDRQRRHPPLPGRARRQGQAGRAAAALGVPGLALSRGQGGAARPVARRAGRRENAGADAAGIAGVGVVVAVIPGRREAPNPESRHLLRVRFWILRVRSL